MNRRILTKLSWYLIWIVPTTLIITHMFYHMWIGGGHLVMRRVTVLPFVPDGVAGVESLLALGFGIYLGLLSLYVNDYRKKYQSVLLGLGTFIVVGGLAAFGIGVVNIFSEPLNVGLLVLGWVFGIILEGITIPSRNIEGALLSIDPDQSSLGHMVTYDGEPAEFKNATWGLLGLIAVVVVGGNLLYLVVHGLGVEELAWSGLYAVATLVFFRFLLEFMTYNQEDEEPDSATSFEVLGPQQSGKTYFALATYLAVVNNPDRYDLQRPTGDMRRLIKEYNRSRNAGKENGSSKLGWTIGNTLPDEPSPLGFEFEARDRWPPKRIEMNMLDHAGELLEMVSDRLSGEFPATDGGMREDEDEGENDEADKTATVGDVHIFADMDDDTGGSGSTETAEDVMEGGSETESPDKSDGDASDSTTADETEEETNGVGSEDIIGSDKTTGDVDEETMTETTDSEPAEEAHNKSTVDLSSDDSESTSSTGEPNDGETEPDTRSDKVAPKGTTAQAAEQLTRNVQFADKLVFILDSQRFYGEAPVAETTADMKVEHFLDIVENVDVDKVILVATKADFFIENWQDEKDHQLRPTSNEQRFKSFRDYVKEQMREDLEIESLFQTVSASTIHPVYFMTEVREDGDKYPKSDENGNIQPVGFDKALEALIRDA